MANIKKWILPTGIFLCGTVLCTVAYDRATPIRNVIWCALTIVMLLCTKEIKVGKIHFFAIGYFVCMLASGVFAVNKSEWIYWILRMSLVIIYLSVAEIDEKLLAKTMILLGAVFFVYFWWDYSQMGSFYHSRGLMRQRNTWAAAQFFVIPFCYYAISKKFWRPLAIFIMVMMVLDIFLLNSRSAMLAVAVSVMIVTVMNKKLRWVSLTALIVIVVVACLKTTVFRLHGDSLISTSLHYRLEQWKYTMSMIHANPFGVGTGNWWIEFPKYAAGIDYPSAFLTQVFRFPHNDFLWVWSETGIGILFYLGMFILALYYTWKRRATYLLIALVGLIVIAFFTSLRERSFTSLMTATFLLIACERKTVIRQPRILLTVLVFTLVVFGFRFRASCWNKKLLNAQTNAQKIYTSRGYSVFSTLTYNGFPWRWWSGVNNYEISRKDLAHRQFQLAYKANPHNINALNGMGIAKGIEGDREQAAKYFEEALRICPEFSTARENLEVLNVRNRQTKK